MRLKIIFLIAVVITFVGCFFSYQDNLINSSYIDPGGPRRHLEWFDIIIPLFSLVAVIAGVILYHRKFLED